MDSPWIVTPKKKPHAKLKLICIPYAGGGTSVYMPWINKLHADAELHIVQLPGRGTHYSHSPIDNMPELITALFPKIKHLLTQDYVIFGHSLGARIGYELAKTALKHNLAAPLHFFSSGSGSPKGRATTKQTYSLPNKEFIAELKSMNGTPEEVLENEELMEFILPSLRADFKIADQYKCTNNIILPCDGSILTGNEDPIEEQYIEDWHTFFNHATRYKLAGDHFFINSNQFEVIKIVNQQLTGILHKNQVELV